MSEQKTTPSQSPAPKKISQLSLMECKLQTIEHIEEVRKNIKWFADKLTLRGICHDRSKLEPPESDGFAEHFTKLSTLVYGSEEYKRDLEDLKTTLEHHYAKNRHHPEHFERGIGDMTLIDIVEMFCDWRASAKRNKNGNLLKSIETNAARFRIDGQLEQIFINTAKSIDESE